MSDTAGHRAEMHVLATERRKRGLPSWAETIDLSAFWRNEEMPWEEKRTRIVAAVKASKFYTRATSGHKHSAFADECLMMCVDNIEESKDADEFDQYWDEFYDLADYARVWLKTF